MPGDSMVTPEEWKRVEEIVAANPERLAIGIDGEIWMYRNGQVLGAMHPKTLLNAADGKELLREEIGTEDKKQAEG